MIDFVDKVRLIAEQEVWRCSNELDIESIPFCIRSSDETRLSAKSRHVCLHKNQFDDFLTVLPSFPSINSLCFHFSPSVSQLESIVNCSPLGRWRFLDFGYHWLSADKEFIEALIRACELHPVQVLRLQSCRVGSGGLRKLCAFLASDRQTSLLKLRLDGNELDDVEDWRAVCELIRHCKTLQSLTLTDNWIGEKLRNDHVQWLGIALACSQSLTRLDVLNCFDISESSRHCFAEVVPFVTSRNLRLKDFNYRDTFHCRLQSIVLDDFCKRNREFFERSRLIALLIQRFSALTPLALPLYTMLNLFDWLLLFEQADFFAEHFPVVTKDTLNAIEHYCVDEKLQTLLNLRERFDSLHGFNCYR